MWLQLLLEWWCVMWADGGVVCAASTVAQTMFVVAFLRNASGQPVASLAVNTHTVV